MLGACPAGRAISSLLLAFAGVVMSISSPSWASGISSLSVFVSLVCYVVVIVFTCSFSFRFSSILGPLFCLFVC